MICGAKWKTCNCPWFNYEQIEADRLNHMRVPVAIRVRRDGGHHDAPGYAEEMERRRRQEARDEQMARRLQAFGLDGADNVNRHGDVFGLGNAQDHHMNQDYVQAAANILGGAYDQAAAAANQAMGIHVGRRRSGRHGRNHEQREDNAGNPLLQDPPPPLRQHSTASRRYNEAAATRPSERVVPRRTNTDYANEYVRHVPLQRAGNAIPRRLAYETRRYSMMAGLTRHRNSEGGRVGAWLQHVEDGVAPNEGPRNDGIAVEG